MSTERGIKQDIWSLQLILRSLPSQFAGTCNRTRASRHCPTQHTGSVGLFFSRVSRYTAQQTCCLTGPPGSHAHAFPTSSWSPCSFSGRFPMASPRQKEHKENEHCPVLASGSNTLPHRMVHIHAAPRELGFECPAGADARPERGAAPALGLGLRPAQQAPLPSDDNEQHCRSAADRQPYIPTQHVCNIRRTAACSR